MNIFKLFGEIAIENEKANESIDDTTDKAEQSESRITSAFKKIGGIVATAFAVDKIVEFGRTCVENAATVQAQNAQFEATFGSLGDEAQKAFGRVAESTGILSTRLQVEGTKAFSMFKGAGMDANTALVETEKFMSLAADAAAYYDISLEEASERVLGFAKGNFENGDAIGVFTNEAQRNTVAMDKYGKKYSECTEAQKQMMALDMIGHTYEMSGALGQATREADGYENVTGNLKEAWRQFKAVIGAPILQAVIPIIKNITSAVSGMSEKLKSSKSITEGFTSIFSDFVAKAQEAIPKVVEKAAEMMTQFGETIQANLPTVVSKGLDMIEGFVDMIAQNLPTLIQAGVGMLQNIAQGIAETLPTLIEKIPTIVSKVANLINDNAPTILAAGVNIIITLGRGLIEAIPTLIANIPQIIQAIWDAFTAFNWLNLGKTLIGGIKNGVTNAGEGLKSSVKNIFENIKNTVSNLSNAAKNVATNIWNALKSGVSGIASGLKNFIVNIWNGIQSMTSSIFGGVKSIATTIWNGIKSAISSVVNAIKSVVSSVWNGIQSATSSVFNSIKGTATSVWNSIKSAITNPIETAKNAVKSAIDKMKSFFNFSWSLPPLKLPHISISGKFSINPPSVPHFGIEWYKHGGIMEEPTLFGYNGFTGKAMVGGEAGAEAITPIAVLLDYVRTAVKEENAGMGAKLERLIILLDAYLPQIIAKIGSDIYLDTGELVGAMGDGMDMKLGEIAKMKARGN